MRQWVKLITKIIEEENKPLSRNDIYKIITEEKGFHISDVNVGVQLNAAKKMGVIAHIKLEKIRSSYYCNPNWLDEEGKLKFEFNPFWSKEKENEPDKN